MYLLIGDAGFGEKKACIMTSFPTVGTKYPPGQNKWSSEPAQARTLYPFVCKGGTGLDNYVSACPILLGRSAFSKTAFEP